MVSHRIRSVFLVFLVAQFIIDVSSHSLFESNVAFVGKEHNSFQIELLTREQIICSLPLQKYPDKVFSSGKVLIKSNVSCTKIIEDVNITDLGSIKNNPSGSIYGLFDFVKLVVSIIRNEKGEAPTTCDREISVPLYRKYCFLIEFNQPPATKRDLTENLTLDVSYQFTYIDAKMVCYFLIGLGLFFAAEELSKNEIFYYASGISIGVLGAILIFVIILIRFIPQKKVAALVFITSSSVFGFFYKWLISDFKATFDRFQLYAVAYIAMSATISGIYLYLREPLKNQRVFNLIEWALKFMGMLLICFGISYKEISLSLILGYYLTNVLYTISTRLTFISKIKNRYFPEKRPLLSQEEYQKEANEYTRKALQELKEYCRSPDFNTWKTLRRLNNPQKMINFVSDDEYSHLSDEEVQEYEKYTVSNDLIDDENEE